MGVTWSSFDIRNMLSHSDFIKVVCRHGELLSSLDAKSIDVYGKRRITDLLLSKKLIDTLDSDQFNQ